jgi:epoxyqueuosine reductase
VSSEKISKEFRKSALGHGFSAIKIIPYQPPKLAYRQFYRNWVKIQNLGRQSYLNRIRIRFNASRIFKPINSLIVLTAPYFSKENSQFLKHEAKSKIARYAHGKDYHRVLKKRCERLIKEFKLNARPIVDSAPFPERYYASFSGIGSIGKNGMLIHPEQGSYLFLTFILVSDFFDQYDRETEKSYKDQLNEMCGSCDRCVRACPTEALIGNGTLKLDRCLSTITIEEPLGINKRLNREKKHRWIFGCDVCQQVCPYNHKSLESSIPEFSLTEVAKKIMKEEGISENQADSLNGTALKRAGLKKLLENIMRNYHL